MTDRSVLVRLKANASDFNRAMVGAKAAVKGLREEIDTTNDRTAWLAQGILALGPAIAPLGAAAVPVISGLATQMTIAAGAAATLGLAFNGVGDALGTLNDYQLDPTIANFEKMQLAMGKIGPDGAEFVQFLDSVGSEFSKLQMAAREGLFPGMAEGIEEFMVLLPQLERVVGNIAEGIGQLTIDAGEGLAGPRFEDFFTYMENEAQPILIQMGHTVGNFVDGIAAMIVAFGPLTADFSAGFESMSKEFADWAHGLDEGNASFEQFVEYVRDSIPKVQDLLGALAEASVAILKAAAPVADVMLPVLTQMLEVVTAIAETPLGPVILSLAAVASAYGRLKALQTITTGGMFGSVTAGFTDSTKAAKAAIPSLSQWGTAIYRAGQGAEYQSEKTKAANAQIKEFGKSAAPAAAQAAGLAFVMSDLDDSMGLTNTAAFALMGTLVGPLGAALGATTGFMLDFAAANDDAAAAASNLKESLGGTDFAQVLSGAGKFDTQMSGFEKTAQKLGTTAKLIPVAGTYIEGGLRKLFDGQREELTEVADLAFHAEKAAKRLAVALGAEFTTELAGSPLLTAMGFPGIKTLNVDAEQMQQVLRNAQPAMDALNISVEDLANMTVSQQDHVFAQIRGWVAHADSDAGRVTQVSDAVADLGSEYLTTAQSASAFAEALNALVNPQVNQRRALLEWKDSLRNIADDLDKTSRSLDGNTDAGTKNQLAILDRVNALQATLTADAEAGASAEQLTLKMRNGRQALIDAAVAAGLNKKEVEKMIAQMGLTPRLIETLILAHTEGAKAKVAELKRLIASITGKTVTVQVNRVFSGVGDMLGDVFGSANGNIFRAGSRPVVAYAGGGMDVANGHQPEIAGPGPVRMWREPETQGEAYVPLADDARRPRAKSILEQTAAMFGGDVTWYANGGFNGSRPVPASAGQSMQMHVTGVLATPWGPARIEGIARDVARQEIDAEKEFERVLQRG